MSQSINNRLIENDTKQLTGTKMINFSIKDDIAIIELDDGKANVFSKTNSEAVIESLKKAQSDAKATVIQATGDKFSAGFDLSVMGGSEQDKNTMVLTGFQMLQQIYSHPQPLVVACNGHALGMGAFTLLAADTRIGAEGDYKIGLPETAGGMPFTRFLLCILQAELKTSFIKTAALQSQMCNPTTAIDAGFLDMLVPPQALQASAIKAAQQLAQLPTKQYGYNKRELRQDTLKTMSNSLEALSKAGSLA